MREFDLDSGVVLFQFKGIQEKKQLFQKQNEGLQISEDKITDVHKEGSQQNTSTNQLELCAVHTE